MCDARATHWGEPSNARVFGCRAAAANPCGQRAKRVCTTRAKQQTRAIMSLETAVTAAAHDTKKDTQACAHEEKQGIKWGDQLIDPHQQASRIWYEQQRPPVPYPPNQTPISP